ncbi:hypothetical protein RF11_04657 [Thelohanellus kitauei]|uniref:Uncharacterized protein n=1 Tax=Thelohanellus kitauei TaxID=669202 RepID=A0A0C2NJW3_THEKT|nr:hypothetical protein RF11_04657 [Thelohanellus kitauei]
MLSDTDLLLAAVLGTDDFLAGEITSVNIHDLPFFLTVKRLNENETDYIDEATMNQQAQHHFMTILTACTADVFMLIVAAMMVTFPILIQSHRTWVPSPVPAGTVAYSNCHELADNLKG